MAPDVSDGKACSSSSAPSLAPSCSPSRSGLVEVLLHVPSAIVSLYACWQAGRWLPHCLSLVRNPQGGVTHDLWSWLPLALCLGALIAIAAPTSFRSLLSAARSIWSVRKELPPP